MGKKGKELDIDMEFVPEEDPSTSSGFRTKDAQELRKETKKALKKAKEYLDGWQRAKADLINFKRESEEGKKDFARFANQDFIQELLPVIDSFEMALSHIDDKGVEQIRSQLLSVLKSRGVEQVSVGGEAFDPTQHDSIETVVVDTKKDDGKIIEVVQTGYTLHGKVIRAPKVKVGKYE